MTMLAGLFALTQDDPAWEAAQTNFTRAVRSLVPTAELNSRPGLLLASLPYAQRTARPVLPLHLDIAGDLRLDNRAELIDRLGVSGPITDLDLVGLGYQRWGEETALRLEGDFAIAIRDRRNGKLICLRDPFGVRPLYYRQEGGYIAFATRQALLARRGDEPDHGALGRFLIGLDDDANATVFSQVRRLPAAHLLVAGRDAGLAVRRYWSAKPFHAEGKDRAHLLLDRLDRAVGRRFAGDGATGTLLSGGLDSSAITALAARNSLPARLQTYSFGYPGGSPFDERRYVDAVQRHHGLAVGFVPMDDFDPLGEIAELLHPLEDPVFAPGLGKLMRIYDRARADGIRVLLDGHGGDEVVSHGLGLLPELAHAGRWLELWKAAGAVGNVFGMSRGALFSGFLLETRPARRLRRLIPRRGGERTGTPAPIRLSVSRSVHAGHARTRLELGQRSQPRADAGNNAARMEHLVPGHGA
jgi:asparagine synthase (glutamine-hydrolysing)